VNLPFSYRQRQVATLHDYGELHNHCKFLSDELRPFYESGETNYTLAARRNVGRILGEMGELIQQVTQDWLDSHPEIESTLAVFSDEDVC
jgi:hypothetical protein